MRVDGRTDPRNVASVETVDVGRRDVGMLDSVYCKANQQARALACKMYREWGVQGRCEMYKIEYTVDLRLEHRVEEVVKVAVKMRYMQCRRG